MTLSQANKVKDEFLANISHELRTPLNSILGFADLAAEVGDERTQRYAKNISQAATALLTMINDLLDLAKIEAGRAQVRMDKVSVIDACQTLATLMGPLAEKKQLKVSLALPADLPMIVSDASKLQQILYNLLSNAIKFTPVGGEITISAGVEEASRAGEKELFVSVADTGPGIAEADQPHIFEKFYQGRRDADQDGLRNRPGPGNIQGTGQLARGEIGPSQHGGERGGVHADPARRTEDAGAGGNYHPGRRQPSLERRDETANPLVTTLIRGGTNTRW